MEMEINLGRCETCHQKLFAEKFVLELIEKIEYIEDAKIPLAMAFFIGGLIIGIFS